MPLAPASWGTDLPVTAKAMNTALYTYTPGNAHTPSGILFHANRPLLVEGLAAAANQGSSLQGTYTNMGGLTWKNYYDNSVMFGNGADFQYATGTGRFNARVAGSSGVAGSASGYYLIWGNASFTGTANAGGSGAAINENGTTVPGGLQLSSTTRFNAGYALDLSVVGQGAVFGLMGYCADSSAGSFGYNYHQPDYSGDVPRLYAAWTGVSSGGGTVSTLPAPASYTSATSITSSLLNGTTGINGPLSFLDYPPLLRASAAVSQSLTSSTVTVVGVGAATIDTWSGYNTSTHTYTVPVSGVYLVYGLVFYASGSTNTLTAGVQVNGTLNLFGPAYTAAGSGNSACQMTRLLDLHAGDTVSLITYTTGASNSTGTAAPCRLVLVWLSSLAPSDGAWSWTPPLTGYRWQAGTPGSQLPALFTQHLTNDLSFLLQRPYLLAYQSSAQTGLSQNAFHVITMNTLGGRVHTAAGDSYGGWTSGSSNLYTAPADGWYLVQGGYIQAIPSLTPAVCWAGITQAPAGSQTPDEYQHMSTTSASRPPGAEAVGMYYLRAGDTVQPVYQQQDGGGTFSTSVAAGQESSFGIVWMCE